MWQPRPAAPRTRICTHDRARRSDAPGNWAIGRQRSISRIKHDLHRRNAQSARFPANPACGSRAQRLPGRAHVSMTGRTGQTRLGTRLYRSAEVAVLKFRGWRVCARCHRNKQNLRAVRRSGSEFISLSDRILLLVACRPRARVKRACAVGTARRGAQIGRLGAPCKAGGHCCSLAHGCTCRCSPQIRAIGDPIGRAAPPHERSQPRTAHEPRRLNARKAVFERAHIVRACRVG